MLEHALSSMAVANTAPIDFIDQAPIQGSCIQVNIGRSLSNYRGPAALGEMEVLQGRQGALNIVRPLSGYPLNMGDRKEIGWQIGKSDGRLGSGFLRGPAILDIRLQIEPPVFFQNAYLVAVAAEYDGNGLLK